MKNKWQIYFIALVSYSTVHSIRTMWSTLKSNLKQDPFYYPISFLSAIDMMVLFSLAIIMNIVGSKIEGWGAKRTAVICLAFLSSFSTLIGILLVLEVTVKWIYAVLFGLGVGVISSVGWPSCLCVDSC